MDEKHSNKTEGSLIDQASIKIWYDFVKEQAEKRKKAFLIIGGSTLFASLLAGGVIGTFAAIATRDAVRFTVVNWIYYTFTSPVSWIAGGIFFIYAASNP